MTETTLPPLMSSATRELLLVAIAVAVDGLIDVHPRAVARVALDVVEEQMRTIRATSYAAGVADATLAGALAVEGVDRLRIKDGDVLVLRAHRLTAEGAAQLRRQVETAFPGVAAVILQEGMTLQLAEQPNVTTCPDCDQAGRYDHRITVGGRGVYTCPDGHKWQDADETPSSKGATPIASGAKR